MDILVQHEEALGEDVLGEEQQYVGGQLILNLCLFLHLDKIVETAEVSFPACIVAQVRRDLLHSFSELLLAGVVDFQVYQLLLVVELAAQFAHHVGLLVPVGFGVGAAADEPQALPREDHVEEAGGKDQEGPHPRVSVEGVVVLDKAQKLYNQLETEEDDGCGDCEHIDRLRDGHLFLNQQFV